LLVIIDKRGFFMGFIPFFSMWISYLSLFNIGGTFMSFQWDIMLLEVGFLAMFYAPAKDENGEEYTDSISVVIRELYVWLLFRLMTASGMVKLLR
jgi:hypothetical protein